MASPPPDRFVPQPTADGSATFFSAEFGEAYHNSFGAWQEARLQYAIAASLADRARALPGGEPLRLLDICYGLGYNTAAALAEIWTARSDRPVVWAGLELDPAIAPAALPHLTAALKAAAGLDSGAIARVGAIAADLAATGRATAAQFAGTLHLGDARQTLQRLAESGFQADAIFLDPFSPRRCPMLWTVEFLTLAARCLAPTGRLTTYSSAAAVRAGLREAGLQVGPTPPCGRRAPGTVAGFDAAALPPLSPQEREHLQTRAAVPYRDPTLGDDAAAIVRRRAAEQATRNLESTSQWRRRWRSATE